MEIKIINGITCKHFSELEEGVVRNNPNFMRGDGTCKYQNHIFDPGSGTCNDCKEYGEIK